MFEHLKPFRVIIVTGPHRSGSTIATEMIAHDAEKTAVREEAFDFYNESLLAGIVRTKANIVVQCPALFDLMPRLTAPDIAIVMMHRPLDQLRASRKRMFNPKGEALKADIQNKKQLERLGETKGDAARIKYKRWEEWKAKKMIHHPFDVQYTKLSSHPRWIPSSERRKLGTAWHNRRTEV